MNAKELKIEHVEHGVVIRTKTQAVFILKKYAHDLSRFVRAYLNGEALQSSVFGTVMCTPRSDQEGLVFYDTERVNVPTKRLGDLIV